MSKVSRTLSFLTLVILQAIVWYLYLKEKSINGYFPVVLGTLTTYGVVGALNAVIDRNDCGRATFTLCALEILISTVILPLLVGEIWLKYDIKGLKDVGKYYIPATGTCVAVLYTVTCMDNLIIDILVSICLISLTIIGAMHQNVMIALAATIFGIQYFVVTRKELTPFDMPVNDLYNYLLSAFTVATFFGVIKS